MLARIVRIGAPSLGLILPSGAPGRVGQPLRPRVVAVDDVCERRNQNANVRRFLPLRRHHEERNVLLCVAGLQAKRVGAGAQILGHSPLVRGRPTAVVDVVLVEMDGRVFLGRVPPGHFAACPFRAGDRAGRHVDELAVQPVRPDVDNAGRRNLLREVPAGDQPWHLLTIGGSGDLIRGENAIEDHWPLDAAVERQPTALVARRADQDLP